MTLEDPAGQQQEQPALSGGATYQCFASGMVNVCSSPGNCMYRTASGVGLGADQASASQMARTACQGQGIAMGGSVVCHVTCKAK